MKDPTRGPIFACLYQGLCDVARKHGYALAIHGTLVEDMDLIAVPWVEDAADAETLKDALTKHIGACGYSELLKRDSPWLSSENRAAIVASECDASDGRHNKPHGRVGWNLYLYAGTKVDLSIFPRSNANMLAPAEIERNLS